MSLSGFPYLSLQIARLALVKIFLISSKIGELLISYLGYPTNGVCNQAKKFSIVALVKSNQDYLLGL
jgi:hypothetical protein